MSTHGTPPRKHYAFFRRLSESLFPGRTRPRSVELAPAWEVQQLSTALQSSAPLVTVTLSRLTAESLLVALLDGDT